MKTGGPVWQFGPLRAALAPLSGAGMAWAFLDDRRVVTGLLGLALLFALAISAPRPRRAALDCALAASVFYAVLLRWFAAAILDFSALPGWMAAGAVILPAVIFGLEAGGAGWVAARVGSRWGPWGAGLALPALWVGLEWVHGRFPLPFPWGSLSAMVAAEPVAAALARVCGAGGLSLIAALAAAALALTLTGVRRAPWALAAATALIFALTAAAPEPEAEREVAVAVLQGALPREADDLSRLALYEQLSEQAAEQGAQLVVWPESAVRYRLDIHPNYRRRVEGLALRLGVDLLLGTVSLGPRGSRLNCAALITREGVLASLSAKRRLVPFGEYLPWRRLLGSMPALAAEAGDFSPGEEVVIHRTAAAPVGALICFEAVFERAGQEQAAAGARLLANLTNDSWFGWTSGPAQHLRHARLRAAETGLPLARAANSGISAIFDAGGRCLGRLDLGERGVLLRRVGVPSGPLGGVRVGSVISGACATLAGLLLGLAFLPRPAVPEVDSEDEVGAEPGDCDA